MNIDVFGEQIPIVVIETKEQLIKAVDELKESKILAIDTEFDRMRTKYGMNLELIQIYDRRQVYMIRVARIKDIQLLKPVLEDKNVLKLIYSAEQDIEAIKSHEINLQGLYDLQVAAKLTGCKSSSFIALVEEMFGIILNKKEQNSDWGTKQLTDEQIRYAANDVLFSFHLYSILDEKVKKNKGEAILKTKNESLERTQPTAFKPKLKGRHKELSRADQRKTLKLLELRAQIAEKRNVPPHFVFNDAFMDEVVSIGNNFQDISSLNNCPKRYSELSKERDWVNERIKELMSTK
jgi:ribonuclease D